MPEPAPLSCAYLPTGLNGSNGRWMLARGAWWCRWSTIVRRRCVRWSLRSIRRVARAADAARATRRILRKLHRTQRLLTIVDHRHHHAPRASIQRPFEPFNPVGRYAHDRGAGSGIDDGCHHICHQRRIMRAMFHVYDEPVKAEPRHNTGRWDAGQAQPGPQSRFASFELFFHLVCSHQFLIFLLNLLGSGRDSNRAHGRAGRAAQLERQADEGKFIALIARQFLQEEVFYDIDAVTDEQNYMAGQRDVEIGIDKAHLIPRYIVGSYGSHSPVGKPGGGAAVRPARL